jgi:hypothetical protein
VAKAAFWTDTDAEARKPGERTGLDTPVVLAVNDEHLVWGVEESLCAEDNSISVPPGEYGRKAETQRN